jgi:glutathione peroxidase
MPFTKNTKSIAELPGAETGLSFRERPKRRNAKCGGFPEAQLALCWPADPIPAARRLPMTAADNAHQFEFVSIDGEKLPLDAWRGRPVLVVNTASFCGYTSQYRGLEALWQRYRDRGLVVLGVPSNDFGQQEPGSAAEIKEFCETNYAVDFPLAEKCRVVGTPAHPFYRWIADSLGEAGTPRWNFHKFLIAPDGELAGTWPSQVAPGDPRITGEIDKMLPPPG